MNGRDDRAALAEVDVVGRGAPIAQPEELDTVGAHPPIGLPVQRIEFPITKIPYRPATIGVRTFVEHGSHLFIPKLRSAP